MMLQSGILLLEFNLQYKFIYYNLTRTKHYRLQNIRLHEQYEGCFSYYQEGFLSGARLLFLLAMVSIRCVPDSCFLCKTQKRFIKSKVNVQILDTLPSEAQATSDKLPLVSYSHCLFWRNHRKVQHIVLGAIGVHTWNKSERISYTITVLTMNMKC